MLEVERRCGVARTGAWRAGELSLRIPCALYFTSPRFPPPPYVEALLSSTPITDSRPVIVDRGSVFSPRERPEGFSIPPDLAIPPGMDSRGAGEPESPLLNVISDARGVTSGKTEVFVLGGAASYLRDARGFAENIVELRRAVGPGRLLYAPGLAVPANVSVLAYCGIDIFDSLAVLFEASRGFWLSPDGALVRDSLSRPPCMCRACTSEDGRRALVEHNEIALWEELELVRACVVAGNLRELVEKRAVNSPWNTAVLRHMDLRHHDFQEEYAPVSGGSLKAYSHQSLTRPEILRFRRRVKERYEKPPSTRVLLLLPCSARKPYSLSKSHRMFRDAVTSCGNPGAVHEVIVTSPLGIVPRELEVAYPAAHYDVPVTGDWNRDEAALVREDLASFLETNSYESIIAHIDAERTFLEDMLSGATFTCRGRATDEASLTVLASELRTAVNGMPHVPREERALEDMTSFARFQFGPGGETLLEDSRLRGKYPRTKVVRGETQLAMLTERGLLSLTLDGGRELARKDLHCVEIDDFYPEGSVFAVGVDGASPDIRVGDDVVVRHHGEVRAVGVAQMCATEMIESERGEAVRVRHALRSKPI